MSLSDFPFIFVLESVYFICCCSITNTVISLVAHKLHLIHMNNQEKFTTRSSKLKVHRAIWQTISSYRVRFFQRYSLFFFSFFCFLSSCFLFFLKLKIYILIHIRLSGRVSDKKISPGRFPETRLLFGPTNKINKLHERALRIVFHDYKSTFDQLLQKDHTFSIHHENIESLRLKCTKHLKMYQNLEAVFWKCSVKTVLLKISRNSQENSCARVSFLIKLQLQTLGQVFSCKFC